MNVNDEQQTIKNMNEVISIIYNLDKYFQKFRVSIHSNLL